MGQAKPPTQKPVGWHTTIAMCILFHLTYLVLPAVAIVGPIWGAFWSKDDTISTLAYVYTFFYAGWMGISDISSTNLGRPWKWFENIPLFPWMFSYFPMSIQRTGKPLDPRGLYVFGAHPHGVLAFNRAMFGFSTNTLWDKAFPGVDFRVLTASAAFKIPVIRELWLWTSCIDASKHVARKALLARKSLLLYPGGEKEQMLTVKGRHRLYLRERKGFIKIALESGASLVPIYVFGECDLYDSWSFLLSFRKMLVAKFGVAIPLISGAFGLLPYRVPVTAVVGQEIKVTRTPAGRAPTQEEVDELHSKYVAALTALFDEHKASQGYPNAVLEIQ